MPHKRNGREARRRRQEAAQNRQPKSAEQKLLLEIFSKNKGEEPYDPHGGQKHRVYEEN